MKKNKILVHLCALLLLTTQVNSQTFYPAILNDNIYATPSTQCTSLNVDMLEMPRFGGTIQAVAWSDNIAGQDHVIYKVGTSWGGYVTDTLPKYSKNPDIVIADDYMYPIGYLYIVAVVYELQGSVYLNTYRVWNIPNNIPWVVQISGAIVSTPNNPASNPHIDLFSDNINQVPFTNAPSMHEFAICWQENTGNTFDELMAVTGDIITPTTFNPVPWSPAVMDVSMPDIACYTNTATLDKYLAFIYRKHTGPSTTNYEATVFDVTGGINTSYTLETNQTLSYPRIEAQSQYDPLSGNATWMGVGALRISGLFETRMYDANNVGTPISLSNPLANGLNNRLPSIAAATGDPTTGGIGNNQYTSILLPVTNPYIYSMPLPLSGGGFSADYYESNLTTLSSTIAPVVGISSSSNTGLNLMSAWYDGTDIMYKITGNTNQYKTTSVSNGISQKLSVFPNPATNAITVLGVLGKYLITDVTGRIELSGFLSVDNQINIRTLSNGLHIIRFNNNGLSLTTMFTKHE